MTSDMQEPADEQSSWVQRVGWLLLIWLGSVAALGAVAYAFRVVMGWVGLTR